MTRRSRKKSRSAVPEASMAVNAFRFELASELGANPEYRSGHLSSIASREYGAVDGKTVRRMIAEAENNLNRNEGGFKS